jgi:hypothetical protein
MRKLIYLALCCLLAIPLAAQGIGGKAGIGGKTGFGGGPAPLAWTMVQHVPRASGGCGATSCAATVTATGTGNVLVVLGGYHSGTTMSFSSITGACSSSWVIPAGVHQDQGSIGVNGAYCLTSTAGVTTITANYSSTVSGDSQLDVIEYHWSGSTIAVDGTPASSQNGSCVSPCAGVAQTLTGASDVIVQWIVWNAPSAISGVYTNPFDVVSTNQGFAGAINTIVGTAPTWTGATFQVERASMAFSGS